MVVATGCRDQLQQPVALTIALFINRVTIICQVFVLQSCVDCVQLLQSIALLTRSYRIGQKLQLV